MAKYLLVSLILLTVQLHGQNCPVGYEERNVKCNNKIDRKCIPVNQINIASWYIKWADCNGSFETSQYADVFNSYEACFQAAQKAKTESWFNCPKMRRDITKFLIYLDDSNTCIGGMGKSEVIRELKNKITPFLKRYIAEITSYKRYFSGQPYKPGSVYKEYQNVLKQAEDNANRLSFRLNSITDENLSQVEAEFEKVMNDEKRLIQADANYRNSITGSNISNGSSSTNSNVKKNASEQSQVKTINEQYQTRRESNKQFINTLENGVQNIVDMLNQNAQKRAEQRKRQFEREQQERVQMKEAQVEKERKLQEEEDRINREMMRQFSIDSTILSVNNVTLKTGSIGSHVDSVYYIGYKRKYENTRIAPPVSLKVFVVYRYSDGTFPLFSNVIEKSKFENNINRSGITLLVGFFKSRSEVFNAMENIQVNARGFGIASEADKNIRKINLLNPSLAKDEEFWNQ